MFDLNIWRGESTSFHIRKIMYAHLASVVINNYKP